MSDTEQLRSALAGRERALRHERMENAQASALLRVMDALHAADGVDGGIAQALAICQQATAADIGVLLRQGDDACMETLHATDLAFGTPVWAIEQGTLAIERRVSTLDQARFLAGLPAGAQAFGSLLSVPVVVPDEPLMALVLLARQESRFSRFDMALMRRVATVFERAFDRHRLAHRATVLSGILGADNAAMGAKPAFLDPSFTALSQAFSHVTDWQGAIVEITNTLLSARSGAIDAAIDDALSRTGALAGSDRTYVFRLRLPDRIDNTHEWAAEGIEPMIDVLQDMPADILNEWRPQLQRGEAVSIPDVNALPDTSQVRDILQMQGIRSLLAVPMLRDGQLTGFVGYDAVRRHRTFLQVEIQLLQAVSNAIGVVLERAKAEADAEAAHKQLQHERNRLNATLSAIPDLLLELDSDAKFTGFSAGARLSPAIERGAMIGRTPEEIFPPHLASTLRAVLKDVDQVGYSSGHEYEMELDGTLRWFEVTAAAKTNKSEPDGYVLLVHETTEARLQQRQIRRLGRIAELTSNLVIVTDIEGRINWVNPAFETRSGWRLHDVQGKKPGGFLQGPRTDPATVRRIREALHKGLPVQAELLNVTRSGEEYWIRKDIQPLTDEDGTLDGFVSVQTDITALKKSHQQALQVRAMAMEASSDGIAIIGPEQTYIYMNPAHRSMFGIGADEDISRLNWSDLAEPEHVIQFISESWKMFQSTGSWQGEWVGRHRSGRSIDLEVTLTRTEQGGILCIARDITERRKIEAEQTRIREELQIAQRRETIAHLASEVAHDLNNLVAVVSGTVSLLRIQCEHEQKICASLDRIERAMRVAGDLVGGLGQLGRKDAPRHRLDLCQIMRESVELLGSARIQKHAVRVVLSDIPVQFWANRTDVLQVILNLALNACDAEGHQPVSVTLEVLPGVDLSRQPDIGRYTAGSAYAAFRVSDTGFGVEKEIRDRLFERYFTTKGDAGTGMGLPIVATILNNNDAALWFESSPGGGTSVTVAWPVDRPADAVADSAGATESVKTTLSGHRILIVDDVADVADVLSEMLETDGAIAISVPDPQEALDALKENPGLWSLLVTDFDMPKFSGADLARAASQLDPPVPVMLVTALPENKNWERSLFSSILSKPVDARCLIEAARTSLSDKPPQ